MSKPFLGIAIMGLLAAGAVLLLRPQNQGEEFSRSPAGPQTVLIALEETEILKPISPETRRTSQEQLASLIVERIDGSLAVVRREVAEEDNGFAVLPAIEEVIEGIKETFGEKALGRARDMAREQESWDAEFAEQLLEAAEPVGELLRVLLEAPDFQFPEAEIPIRQPRYIEGLQFLSGTLGPLQVRQAQEMGESGVAASHIVEQLLLGERLSGGQGTVFHQLVAQTASGSAVASARRMFDDETTQVSDDSLALITDALTETMPNVKTVHEGWGTQYRNQLRLAQLLASDYQAGEPDLQQFSQLLHRADLPYFFELFDEGYARTHEYLEDPEGAAPPLRDELMTRFPEAPFLEDISPRLMAEMAAAFLMPQADRGVAGNHAKLTKSYEELLTRIVEARGNVAGE